MSATIRTAGIRRSLQSIGNVMLHLAETASEASTFAWPIHSASIRPLYGSERLTDDVVVQALDTLRMVRSRVASHVCPARVDAWLSSQHLNDVTGVERFVARSWLETTSVLNSAHDLSPAEVTDLVTVLNRLRDLEAATISHRRSSAASLHQRSVNALFAVSCASSRPALIRSIPEQAATLGFDRVLFSTVASGSWRPRSAFNRDDSDWASRYLTERAAAYRIPSAAAKRHTVRVDAATMLEHQQREFGYALWKRSKSKNFWMIPLIHSHRVVGMIHADCHLSDRLPTQTEIAALQDFCRQVAPLVAQMTIEGTTVTSFPRGLAERESTSDSQRLHVVDPGGPSSRSTLSLREIEVVTLMAEGLTNLQIGRRLTITEGTVKSHVKRILKKTGSANRAEAVAYWLKSPPSRQA